jgi:hypothetical protein
VPSYQRFERSLQKPSRKHIPYLIAGAGGYVNAPKHLHKIEKEINGQRFHQTFQAKHPDLKLMSYNDQNPAFLRITIDNQNKTLTSIRSSGVKKYDIRSSHSSVARVDTNRSILMALQQHKDKK